MHNVNNCAECFQLEQIQAAVLQAISLVDLQNVRRSPLRSRLSARLHAIFGNEGLPRGIYHLVRESQIAVQRYRQMRTLKPHQTGIAEDYGMKLLPSKYRETQTDSFGKTGISMCGFVNY